jgi:hypothetical protein
VSVEAVAMPQVVLIACPETDELVPTGVRVNGRKDLEPVNHLIACPSCGNDHEWIPAEAVVTTATDAFRPSAI